MLFTAAPSPSQDERGLSRVVSPLLLMARICRTINQDQSRTRPWSRAQLEESLLRMTHRALERWHELIDPMMGVKKVSFSGLPQRVIAGSFSDQRGRCQNYKTSFLRLPGNVHSVLPWTEVAGLCSKALPQRPLECYDVIVVWKHLSWTKWYPQNRLGWWPAGILCGGVTMINHLLLALRPSFSVICSVAR